MEFGFSKIEGGITAPRGFRASAVWSGIKPEPWERGDLALLVSDFPAVAAATFTTNKIKAAPVRVSAAHLRSNDTRGIIVNSGNANACTGSTGIQNAKRMAGVGNCGRVGSWGCAGSNRRRRERGGDDRPEHGYDAVLRHDRRVYPEARTAETFPRERGAVVQLHYRGWGYEH